MSIENLTGTEGNPLTAIVDTINRPKRILFIEDDDGMQLLVRSLTSDFNCVLDSATDGERGILMAINGDYDLVMIDIKLAPGGVSGIDVFRKIRAAKGDRRPSCVFFTGCLNDEEAREVEYIGFAPFVKKPFRPTHLFFSSFMHAFGIMEKKRSSEQPPTPPAEN